MTTVALTASPATIDPGTAYELRVLNSGSTVVHVQIGGGSVYDQRLNPGQSVVVHPNGQAVTGFARSGTGQVDTTLATNPEPTVSTGTSVPLSSVGAPSGVAALDGTGKVPSAQLPATGSLTAEVASRRRGKATGIRSLWKAATAGQQIRIANVGTSLASFDRSMGLVLSEHLKNLFGDAGATHIRGALFGGTFTGANNGWVKQPYGGPSFGRSRGDNTSSPMPFRMFGDTVEIVYSKDTGGGSWTVTVDGTTVGTIDSSGTQAYGQIATFTVTRGAHQVVLVPPTTGFAYVEDVRFRDSTQAGVVSYDYTMGGSLLANTQSLSGLNGPTTGVAISGFNGLDAIFARTDFDAIFCTFLVNDAGSNNDINQFYTLVDRAAQQSAAAGIQLVWIVEMAGHFAMPNDANYARYNAYRDYLLALQDNYNHITVIDWHGMTSMTDLLAYAARYYVATGVNLTTATYTGDFIHPNDLGFQVAQVALADALGVAPPKQKLNSRIVADRYRDRLTKPVPSIFVGPDGGRRRFEDAAGTCYLYTSGVPRIAPYYRDDTMPNEAVNLAPNIVGSGTSDSDGTYYTFTGSSAIAPDIPATETTPVFLTLRAKGSIRLRNGVNAYRIDGVTIPNTDSDIVFAPADTTRDYVFSVELAPGTFTSGFTFTGQVYEVSVTRSPVPVLTRKAVRTHREIGPPAFLSGDPAYNDLLLGQRYMEVYTAGALLEKKLVGRCSKWDSTAQAEFTAGLYDAVDRTAMGWKLGKLNSPSGTLTAAPLGGQYAQTDTASQGFLSFGLLDISTAQAFSIAYRVLFNNHNGGLKIVLFNGGNNATRWLGPDGVWNSVSTNVRTMDASMNGRTLGFTFAAPTGADLTALGNTPEVKLYLPSPGGTTPLYGTATLVKGAHACV